MTPLYLLAFDHRSSFRDLLGVEDVGAVRAAKKVVYDGFERAAANGLRGGAGILVDEELGAAVAARANRGGYVLAMPAEKSGRAEFEFEYGDAFGRHVEAFDPAYVKVLVRYNPAGDRELNRRQAQRLRRLSEWLQARDRKLLFELLVPGNPQQIAAAGGRERYDAVVRPDLTCAAIVELQSAGVEPAIWKLEGFDRREHFLAASQVARRDLRATVRCIVLGRGAEMPKVEEWLALAATTPGYAGFAVGRTLWWDALVALSRDEIGRAKAVADIAARFRRLVDVYEAARNHI